MQLFEVNKNQGPRNISLHAWKVILISKNRLKTYSDLAVMDNFKKYLEDDYLQLIKTNSKAVYMSLVKTMFEVHDKEQVENIIGKTIAEYYDQIMLDRKPGSLSIDDLSEIFMFSLATLPVRGTKKGKTVDLFNVIDENNNILSLEEACDLINQKGKTLVK